MTMTPEQAQSAARSALKVIGTIVAMVPYLTPVASQWNGWTDAIVTLVGAGFTIAGLIASHKAAAPTK